MVPYYLMLLAFSAGVVGFNVALDALRAGFPDAPRSFPFSRAGRLLVYAPTLCLALYAAYVLATLAR